MYSIIEQIVICLVKSMLAPQRCNLQGHVANARLVMMPYEDHIYVARETRLDVLAEMFEWFDRYVKNTDK